LLTNDNPALSFEFIYQTFAVYDSKQNYQMMHFYAFFSLALIYICGLKSDE